jgi:hypothetical protein
MLKMSQPSSPAFNQIQTDIASMPTAVSTALQPSALSLHQQHVTVPVISNTTTAMTSPPSTSIPSAPFTATQNQLPQKPVIQDLQRKQDPPFQRIQQQNQTLPQLLLQQQQQSELLRVQQQSQSSIQQGGATEEQVGHLSFTFITPFNQTQLFCVHLHRGRNKNSKDVYRCFPDGAVRGIWGKGER